MDQPLPWVDLFSEGGPFVVAAERAFLAWPGAPGWDEALDELTAPGMLHARDGHVLAFFEPEDPGPVQVGWSHDRLIVARVAEGGGAPAVVGRMDDAARGAFDAAIRATVAREGVERASLGDLVLVDGLVVVAWAAIGGPRWTEGRAGLEALAATSPRQARRFADGGPALTAVQLEPGRYAVTAAFEHHDEAHARVASWLELVWTAPA